MNRPVPVNTITANAVQVHGSSRSISSETGQRRSQTFISRRSNASIVPSSVTMPNRCTISIAGKHHLVSRMSVLSQVSCSALQVRIHVRHSAAPERSKPRRVYHAPLTRCAAQHRAGGSVHFGDTYVRQVPADR